MSWHEDSQCDEPDFELENLCRRADRIACSVLGHQERRHTWTRLGGTVFTWRRCARCGTGLTRPDETGRPTPDDYPIIMSIRDSDLEGD